MSDEKTYIHSLHKRCLYIDVIHEYGAAIGPALFSTNLPQQLNKYTGLFPEECSLTPT